MCAWLAARSAATCIKTSTRPTVTHLTLLYFLDIHGQPLLLFALKSISLFILKFEKQNIIYVNAKPWDYII